MKILELLESVESRNRYAKLDRILTLFIQSYKSIKNVVESIDPKFPPPAPIIHYIVTSLIKLEVLLNTIIENYADVTANIEDFDHDVSFIKSDIRKLRTRLGLL